MLILNGEAIADMPDNSVYGKDLSVACGSGRMGSGAHVVGYALAASVIVGTATIIRRVATR